MFRSWLAHPAYDTWWQAMIPYGKEFADIDIPVLATTGYFDGGQVGVLYYFGQHTQYRPQADHTLVIGPFGHFTMQTGVDRTIQGYDVDPAAMIDLWQLRLDWFDHVFHGARAIRAHAAAPAARRPTREATSFVRPDSVRDVCSHSRPNR